MPPITESPAPALSLPARDARRPLRLITPVRIKGSFLSWSYVFGYMGLIFYLSGQSSPPYRLILPSDKLIHFLEYMLLALLLLKALGGTFPGRTPAALGITAFIIAVIYAASDEFHQSFIPGRNADALDWMADSFGAALGSLTILGRDKLRRS